MRREDIDSCECVAELHDAYRELSLREYGRGEAGLASVLPLVQRLQDKDTYTNLDFPIFHVPAFSVEVGDDLEDGERECPDERD